jgi:hypothetical protein
MPKGKKKNDRPGRGGAGGRKPEASSDSDDDGIASVADNASVISMQGSDGGSTIQDVGAGAVDQVSTEEVFENKMKDAIELATQKSAAGRVKALEALCQGLLKRCVYHHNHSGSESH